MSWVEIGAVVVAWGVSAYMFYDLGYMTGYLKQLSETCDQYAEEARQWKELMIDVGERLAERKEPHP